MTASRTEASVLDWLLEPTNPTARWLALRLLLERPTDDRDVVDAQRAIPGSRWAAAILGRAAARRLLGARQWRMELRPPSKRSAPARRRHPHGPRRSMARVLSRPAGSPIAGSS